MKKFLTSILVLLYFTASSGVVLNVHYCMGHVASVKVDNFSVKAGMCGSDEQQGDCCRDEVKVLKVSNQHKAAVAAYSINLPVVALPTYSSLIDQSSLTSQLADQPVAHAPPGISSPPDYILNCVFRI
jgi:hypothetical protein